VKNRLCLIFAAILVIGLIVSYGRPDRNTAFAEVLLSNVRYDLDIWRLLNNSPLELKQKVAQSLLHKAMLVRSLKPDVNRLGGTALESLCFLTEEKTLEILSYSGDKRLVSIAEEYFSSVKSDVRKRIVELQKTMKGSGCYITPN
jgi:hypothetical protein